MLIIINRSAKQAGDTLIEVMIAIAIVSLAIAIAYSISGKNLNVGITARERTQAVGWAQGQIEIMNQVQQTNSAAMASLKDPTQHFCFNTTSHAITKNTSVDLSVENLNGGGNSYAAGCITSGTNFYLDINYLPPAGSGATASGNSFMFTARWYRLGGGADQIVTIYYRPW